MEEGVFMKDITNIISEGTDVHSKTGESKLTRLNFILSKLENMKSEYDLNKPIITEVYEKSEFVEKVKGSFSDTEEIIEYYNRTFIVTLTKRPEKNTVVIHIDEKLKKSVDG